MRQTIALRVNDDNHILAVDPYRTLVSVLRNDLGLTGTKVGCGGGDCGACTVILDGRSVVSCLTLAVEADGREIVTVEGMASSGREPHPLQRAFVEKGAIQCGFCTPGMQMSAHHLLSRCARPNDNEIRLGLSGNLCRCTGYTKIVEAVAAAAAEMATGPAPAEADTSPLPATSLTPWRSVEPTEAVGPLSGGEGVAGGGYAAPATVEEACRLLAGANGDAVLIAGGTDLMPKLRGAGPQGRRRLLVGLRDIPELSVLACDAASGLHIGAMVRLADVADHAGVRALFPALSEAAAATGTPQIRNMGTVVGNLCNAAPSADNAPALLALEAQVHIAGPTGRRWLPLGDFFEGPGVTRLGPAELVVAVTAPPPPSRSGLSYQYLSERGRVDISAVGVAVFVALTEDGVCEHVRIALGGVAPTPVRVSHAEGLLQGLVWRDPKAMEVVDRAAAAAADAARPINDVRASAGYRLRMVRVLVARALDEALARALADVPSYPRWSDASSRAEASAGPDGPVGERSRP